MVNLKFKSLEG